MTGLNITGSIAGLITGLITGFVADLIIPFLMTPEISMTCGNACALIPCLNSDSGLISGQVLLKRLDGNEALLAVLPGIPSLTSSSGTGFPDATDSG
jgi:hypothetical protein